MWLHVPSMASQSAPVPEDLTSPCTSQSQDIALCVTLSGKPTQRPLSWRGWKTRPWLRLLYGTISQPLTAARGVETWISSLQASRAKAPALPASASGLKMSDGSGPSSGELFAKLGPDGSFLKTSEGCFLSMMDAPSVKFSQTWPARGGLVNGECFQQERRAPVIDESACSSWPTPRASASENRTTKHAPSHGVTHGRTLAGEAGNWATPRARDFRSGKFPNRATSNRRGSDPLNEQVETWLTPMASDSDKCPGGIRGRQSSLQKQSRNWQTPRAREVGNYQYDRGDKSKPLPTLTGQSLSHHQDLETSIDGQKSSPSPRTLNPLFVEWLIGWPIGWTDCASAATGFTRYVARMRTELSRLH